MSAMNIYHTSFLLPKIGSDLEECQDAFAAPDGNGAFTICDVGARLRFAVADGVTTSFYSGYWANQLASLFGAGHLQDEDDHWENKLAEWTCTAHAKWQSYMRTLDEEGKLGFISKNHLLLRTRAAATFCGLEIQGSHDTAKGIPWRLIAVGDSCAIHLSESNPHYFAFPCGTSAAFSCATAAISNYEEPVPEQFKEVTPPCGLTKGDVVILATDALCEWMLKLAERGEPVWKTILDVARNGNDAFRDVVEQARRDLNLDCRLKDDDVALVIIRVGEEFPTWIDSSGWKYRPNIAAFVEEQSNQQSKFAELLNVVPAPVIAESNTSPQGQSEPELRTNEPVDVFQNCPLPQPRWRSIIAYLWEMIRWRKAGNSKQEQALPSPAAESTAADTAPTVTH
jgi:hypothetical protein